MANIITLRDSLVVAFKKSSGGAQITFEPNREYLIANAQLDRIIKDKNVQDRIYRVSRAETYVKNFHVKAYPVGAKILIWNGSGGYGDSILTLPVAKLLNDRYGFQVHILTEPGNNVCYWGMPFLKSIQTIPCLWELIQLFDAFIPFEAVVNMDERQDQKHPTDMMLAKIGIDPDTIPDTEKVVRPVFTENELGSMSSVLKVGKIGIYQLSSANPVRCLPANDSVFMLLKLAEATPDIHWLAIYDEFVPEDYKKSLESVITERKLTNIKVFCAANLRELWALTERASVVVAPDSMMVHVAGVFGVPCVGLWGPMDPFRRVRYYKNHHPLFHKEFCPHCPCFAYSNSFPRYCPPRPDTRKSCDVIAGIAPHEVIELVNKVKI